MEKIFPTFGQATYIVFTAQINLKYFPPAICFQGVALGYKCDQTVTKSWKENQTSENHD